MKYSKHARTWDDQADLLISRGMQGDKAFMIECLQNTNYYRLSGYWYPFRKPNPNSKKPADDFRDDTHFDEVWDRYVFDRELRLLVLDGIERIEVSIKSRLMYHNAHEFGPFGYATNSRSFPNLRETDRQKTLSKIASEINRSKDQFVKHFQDQYGKNHEHLPKDSTALPTWMLCEVVSFGTMQHFYKNSTPRIKQDVAHFASMPSKIFDSWLHALNVIRNVCAHHGRLWNKELGIKPLIPRIQDYPDWHTPVLITKERAFGILTIIKYLLDQICPDNHFASRFTDLIGQHPNIPLVSMGFPDNWKESPIWFHQDPDTPDDDIDHESDV